MANIEYLNAETPAGRKAIHQVIHGSIKVDLEMVPPEWAITRLDDGIPVALILVDPTRIMHYSTKGLSYAYILTVATHQDHRGEGHFQGIMREVFCRLIKAGIPLVGCHGPYYLYNRLGFTVFTHHSGLFLTPEIIERELGRDMPDDPQKWISVSNTPQVLDDLLLVYRSAASTLAEARNALLSAAAVARQKQKSRILIEQPEAPSYGSTYPIYPTPKTPISELARSIGGRIMIQGANPKEGSIPDADWLKVMDVKQLFSLLIDDPIPEPEKLPAGSVQFHTDAGDIHLVSKDGRLFVKDLATDIEAVQWPASALVQLVTGYKSTSVLAQTYQTNLPNDSLTLLDSLFPPVWRFSRNESWTYKS